MSKKQKILYIDDEPINLLLFDINFRDEFEVLTTEDPSVGLEILDQHKDIPLVITDMKMPKMSGLEFIKIAKQKYPDKKYCLLTGLELSEDIESAITLGMVQEYFSKPIDIELIRKSVVSYMALK